MPVHQISSGDFGLYAWSSGSTPIGFYQVYVCESAGGGVYTWVQLAAVWRCTSANPGTGAYTWQPWIVTDKYRPTAVPQSVGAAAGAYGGRPSTITWTEDTGHTPGGAGYALEILPYNMTQGVNGTLINLPSPRGSASYSFATPSGWVTGDEINFSLYYIDGGGYTGPFAYTGNIYIP